MSPYMLVLLFSISIPFVLSFYPPLKFYRKPRALAASIAAVLAVFGAWDVFAVWRGHWHFDPAGVFPMRVINLPLEEALFFVVIPFCCIFTWEAMKYLTQRMRR
ncbi:MAG: lycopene cyclase domain-containing protein [Candidatus Omnitrophica bacterium]|nr:lycopene cyclase domain-containing protein [Candidatus Omnitrophota bacterium]